VSGNLLCHGQSQPWQWQRRTRGGAARRRKAVRLLIAAVVHPNRGTRSWLARHGVLATWLRQTPLAPTLLLALALRLYSGELIRWCDIARRVELGMTQPPCHARTRHRAECAQELGLQRPERSAHIRIQGQRRPHQSCDRTRSRASAAEAVLIRGGPICGWCHMVCGSGLYIPRAKRSVTTRSRSP
jgi:hypothetical protein